VGCRASGETPTPARTVSAMSRCGRVSPFSRVTHEVRADTRNLAVGRPRLSVTSVVTNGLASTPRKEDRETAPSALAQPIVTGQSVDVVRWREDDSFAIGGLEFVCRPVGGRFKSEPGRFCLLKSRADVELYEWVIGDLDPRRIVEIGTYEGGS